MKTDPPKKYTVTLTKDAEKAIGKMPKEIQKSFRSFRDDLSQKPLTELKDWDITRFASGKKKQLKGRLLYRLRINDYRFVFERVEDSYTIKIAGPRGDIYKAANRAK